LSVAVDAPEQARVLIAADHIPTRKGLRLALEPGAVCTEAADSQSAVAAAVRDRPDVCLVDFDAPGRRLHTVNEIVARVPGVLCIVLAHHAEEDEFLAVMRAGASGYLSDALDPARLPFIVAGVMRGEAAVPRHYVARLIDELRGRARTRRSLTVSPERSVELTSREWEAVELLRQGLPTRDIAIQLGISQVTVRRHLSAAYAKLGVTSRASALELLESAERAGPLGADGHAPSDRLS
jgi:DNA-binding NarL/FixJ family response regulator